MVGGCHGFGNDWKEWILSLRVVGVPRRIISSSQLPSILRFLQLDLQALRKSIHFVLPLMNCINFMMLGGQYMQKKRGG